MTPRAAHQEVARDSKRCAIYTRKSTSVGLDEEFSSLDAQWEACLAYIRRQPGWAVLEERYEDGGFTGANTDRPAFQRLVADIDAGRIDVVVVYKVDRLSRSFFDFVELMKLLDKHGVEFVSVTQNFSTTTPMGRFTLNILLSFAEFEREMIAERTRDKIGAARRKGKWTGGPTPLGYVIENKKLVVHELDAALVREIFALYADLGSALAVTRALRERGRVTKRNRAWKRNDVLRILRQPIYAGYMRADGGLCEGEQSAIIERVVFARTQSALAARSTHKQAAVRNHEYFLRGLLYCPCCGSIFAPGSTTKRGVTYRYYRCIMRDQAGGEACRSRPLPAGAIEGHVIDCIRAAIADGTLAADVADAVQRKIQAHRDSILLERRALQPQISSLARDASRLLDTLADAADTSRRHIEARLQRLDAQRASFEARLVAVDHELAHLDGLEVEATWVASCLANFDSVWDVLMPENRGRLVRALIDRIEIDELRHTVTVVLADVAQDLPTVRPPRDLAAMSDPTPSLELPPMETPQ